MSKFTKIIKYTLDGKQMLGVVVNNEVHTIGKASIFTKRVSAKTSQSQLSEYTEGKTIYITSSDNTFPAWSNTVASNVVVEFKTLLVLEGAE